MTMNLSELVEKNNTNGREKKYISFDSKKKFVTSNEFTNYSNEFQLLIKQLKNVFSVAINATENKYIVITMYYSKNKQYEYIVCDTGTFDCTSFDSVKNAKNYINEKINN